MAFKNLGYNFATAIVMYLLTMVFLLLDLGEEVET